MVQGFATKPWKNTEDEILKVAISKYGSRSQWGRISSLLPGRSAKACKARWHEWLLPSIKKTEWSLEEDEKLLHLAKLMPHQWKTISTSLGQRTAQQCINRYEKLLDAATGNKSLESKALKPGDIDPNPETKPAKPDAVDLDDTEREMLEEAKARLTNTKGKKAARLTRQKIAEEADRLVQLQKNREMKAAGIEVSKKRKKKDDKFVDFDTEIPFYIAPVQGEHDTKTEKTENKEFVKISNLALTGSTRAERQLNYDKKREREKKILEDLDMPTEILRHKEKYGTAKRMKLSLPKSSISDKEWHDMKKLKSNWISSTDESEVTNGLLANVVATPFAMNTPDKSNNSSQSKKIEQESLKQANLLTRSTPLTAITKGELNEDYSYSESKVQSDMNNDISMEKKIISESKELDVNDIRAKLEIRLRSLPDPKDNYETIIPETATVTIENENDIEKSNITMNINPKLSNTKAKERYLNEEYMKKAKSLISNEMEKLGSLDLSNISDIYDDSISNLHYLYDSNDTTNSNKIIDTSKMSDKEKCSIYEEKFQTMKQVLANLESFADTLESSVKSKILKLKSEHINLQNSLSDTVESVKSAKSELEFQSKVLVEEETKIIPNRISELVSLKNKLKNRGNDLERLYIEAERTKQELRNILSQLEKSK